MVDAAEVSTTALELVLKNEGEMDRDFEPVENFDMSVNVINLVPHVGEHAANFARYDQAEHSAKHDLDQLLEYTKCLVDESLKQFSNKLGSYIFVKVIGQVECNNLSYHLVVAPMLIQKFIRHASLHIPIAH